MTPISQEALVQRFIEQWQFECCGHYAQMDNAEDGSEIAICGHCGCPLEEHAMRALVDEINILRTAVLERRVDRGEAEPVSRPKAVVVRSMRLLAFAKERGWDADQMTASAFLMATASLLAGTVSFAQVVALFGEIWLAAEQKIGQEAISRVTEHLLAKISPREVH